MFDLITPISYWILVLLWLAILWVYLSKFRQLKALGGAVAVLLVILSIDAFRTLFESIYFGLYFNSLFGLLPKTIHDALAEPALLIIPKLVNVITGLMILFLLTRPWIPRELDEREQWIKNLQEKEQQFSVLLDKSPMAIRIAKDRGKTLVYANALYKKVLDAHYTPSLGEDPSQYYTQTRDYDDIIKELEQGATVKNRLVQLISRDDETFWFLASYSPIQYQGEPRFTGLVLRYH